MNPDFETKAFPRTTSQQKGMDLRDYFAAKAMQAICTSPLVAQRDERYDETNWDKVVAANAYEFADAMMEARLKSNSEAISNLNTKDSKNTRSEA